MTTHTNTTAPHVEASIETGGGTSRVKDYLIGFAFVAILGLLSLVYGDVRSRIAESESRERARDLAAQATKDSLLEKIAAQDKEAAKRAQQLDDMGRDMHDVKTDVHDIKVELTRRRVP